jgi:rhodanese-related sulfurtransferase
VSLLDGGIAAWDDAGFVLFGGVNVPSKAFGEIVEHWFDTPSISAEELKAMMDRGENMVVLDSRPWGEYHRMSIPTGIDCPGAELAYRVHDIVGDPETTVVVNCAGRTRSIIGAQSLINAGLPNKVVALRNGTMGWALAGYQLDTGRERKFSEITPAGLASAQQVAARVAARFGVETIGADRLADWRAETDRRSLFLLDVRNPDEYAAGHVPGSISAPGGQLVQATDAYVGVRGARLVLIDDDGVRATMTASWLIQLGWKEVAVLEGGLGGALDTGPTQPEIVGLDDLVIETMDAQALDAMVQGGDATIVDVATSLQYKAGHIAGAWWSVRSRLAGSLERIPGAGTLVFTSPDGQLARFAANDAAKLGPRAALALEGGTAAWVEAGLPTQTGFENMAEENNDVQYKAYDYDDNIEEHMREYLSWETGLVEQVERDGTTRFRHIPPG